MLKWIKIQLRNGHADKILDQNWPGGKQYLPMRIN